MAGIELWNNLINANDVYKVALKIVQNENDANDLWMRIQGNTDGYPFRYNVDSSETYRNLFNLHSTFEVLFTNIRLFNTDKILFMTRMFENCVNISGNLNMTPINVSNAEYAFRNTGVITTQQIYSPNLHNTYAMFEDCAHLSTANFKSPSDNGDVNISHMYANCVNINSTPNLILNGCNTVDASHLFDGCIGITGNVWSLLKGLDNITNFAYMFNNCRNLNAEFNQFDVHDEFLKATNLAYMFAGCRHYNTVPYIQAVYPSINCDGMYDNCELAMFTPFFIENKSTPTHLANTFRNCKRITGTVIFPQSILINNNPLPANGVRYLNLHGTFADCERLDGIAISGKNTYFDNETFLNWKNKVIWVKDRNDFRYLLTGATGLTFGNAEVNQGGVTLNFNNYYTQQLQSVTFPHNQVAIDETNNVTLYCYEEELPDAIKLNHFSFRELGWNYANGKVSDTGLINNMLNNINYIGFNDIPLF